MEKEHPPTECAAQFRFNLTVLVHKLQYLKLTSVLVSNT